MAKDILYASKNQIGTITLNRPDVLNALSLEMVEMLHDIFDQVKNYTDLKVLLLESSGKHFMAGGDVNLFATLTSKPRDRQDAMRPLMKVVHELIEKMIGCDLPIVTKVQGATAGFGMSLVMASDIVIMSEDAKMHPAYIHLGLSPDGLFSYHLPKAVGIKQAMYMSLLGEPISASKAYEFGLVSKVVPPEQMDAAVKEVIDAVSCMSQKAIRHTKHLINDSFNESRSRHSKRELQAFEDCIGSEEFVTNVMKFIQKQSH